MTGDTTEKIFLVFLGWLLGLLAPAIVDSIKRKRENKLGRAAILSELSELACTLCAAAYGVRMELGTADRHFLEWLKVFLEQNAITPEFQRFIPNLRAQLSGSDADPETAVRDMAAKKGKGVLLQYYSVPILDARVSALSSFDTSFQRQLLEIRRRVAFLDDFVDRSRKYFDLTFTKLEGDNHRLVTENFNQTCTLYAEEAIRIVDLVRGLKQTN